MERMDYYEILPSGMETYLSFHGHHISKPMFEWAVEMMDDGSGKPQKPIEKKEFEDKMKANGLTINRKDGFYDGPYVWCMAKSDYLGRSVVDEHHLALYVKDYIDDVDGNETRAFDELVTNLMAKGVDIPWLDIL